MAYKSVRRLIIEALTVKVPLATNTPEENYDGLLWNKALLRMTGEQLLEEYKDLIRGQD